MAKTFDGIDEHLRRWIAAQPVFFVGSAPLAGDGHVNVSPKGPAGTLRILDSRRVAYLDFVGSGAETVAHLRENGRIVVMFCAFQGPPRIVRLHGRGTVTVPGESEFAALHTEAGFDEPAHPEARRSIVVVDVERVADSCGYGVPLMAYKGQRPHFDLWAGKKLRTRGDDALVDYQREFNALSIDGLPGIEV